VAAVPDVQTSSSIISTRWRALSGWPSAAALRRNCVLVGDAASRQEKENLGKQR